MKLLRKNSYNNTRTKQFQYSLHLLPTFHFADNLLFCVFEIHYIANKKVTQKPSSWNEGVGVFLTNIQRQMGK